MDKTLPSQAKSADAQSAPLTQAKSSTFHKSRPFKTWSQKSWLKPLIVLIIVIVVIVGGGMLWQSHKQATTGASTVNNKEYQAVFLSNGQVYFGKLETVNQYYLKLVDIYYLQVQQSVQPASSADGSSTASDSSAAASSLSGNSSSNSSVQLVKLGNELHGPEDEMTINRSQVLFWENLKASGKVTQAIDQYQSK